MFPEFLAEVDVMAAEIAVGTETGEFSTSPVVADVEERVEIVVGDWLKALFLVLRKRIDAMSAEHRDAQGSYDEKKEERLNFELGSLVKLASAELRSACGVFAADEILELRAGWTVVKVKMPPRQTGIEVVDLRDLIADENRDCGREDCPSCTLRRARRAARDKRNKAAAQA